MELSFRDLQKRDVINIVDGRSFGRIKDIQLSFPQGKLVGIVVPGRRDGFILRLFDRNKIYIPEHNIIKIGGDVILVNVNCGDTCSPSTNPNVKPKKKPDCSPPCPPICPPPRPKKDVNPHENYGNFEQNLLQSFNEDDEY